MLTPTTPRYEIEGGDSEWKDAEKSVEKATKSGKGNPLVSVKTKTKRKAETEEVEVNEKSNGGERGGHGKSKKPKREKRK